jgi:nucleoside-diphosphate-sugar epimerase
MNTFLITGATGFIGASLARELLSQGQRVVAFDNRPNLEPIKDIYDKITMIIGDVTDLADVARAIKSSNPNFIVHLASLHMRASGENPLKAIRVNTEATCKIFEAARIMDVKRIVWASSVAVYGPASKYPNRPVDEDDPMYPTTMYGACKMMNEFLGQHYNASGVDNVGLRFTHVYGPGVEFTARDKLLSFYYDLYENAPFEKPSRVEKPGLILDWLYISDCVKAIIRAALAKGLRHNVFNICGYRHSLREVADHVQKLVPNVKMSVATEETKDLADALAFSIFDGGRASDELGYTPEHDIDLGWKKTINYYRAKASLKPV